MNYPVDMSMWGCGGCGGCGGNAMDLAMANANWFGLNGWNWNCWNASAPCAATPCATPCSLGMQGGFTSSDGFQPNSLLVTSRIALCY